MSPTPLTEGLNDESRATSLLDATCEDFVYDLAEHSPTRATMWGLEGFDDQLQDFSPDYWDALADRSRDMIADVDALNDGTDASDDDDDFDEIDHVTAQVLRDRLGVGMDLHHQGEMLALLNNSHSPVQMIRDVFPLMPQDTPEQLEMIRARLSQVGKALAGYRESLASAASQGHVAAHRQVDAVISQCEDLGDSDSLFDHLGLPEGTPEVDDAREAFAEMAEWLSTELAPHAPHEDGVGRDRYELLSHYHLGDAIDLNEAYEWGLHSLQEIIAEQTKAARELYGEGCSVRGAIRKLNQDERYQLHGTEALIAWAQEKCDAVTAKIADHFSQPEQIRALEARIDIAGTGSVFYVMPSLDFSRPGRILWSVPEGQEVFHTWQELTTLFHEGIPGHHLRAGTALCQQDTLNLWRRLACHTAGNSEGWALWSETLMKELGYFDDPGLYMGYLDSQRFRAARVVLDIGVHLHKKNLEGSGIWDAAYAKAFLRDNSAMNDANLSFEVDRYLGWPGQAPAQAWGQRMWQQTRADALAQGQTASEFYAHALKLGSVPMSIVHEEVLD